LVEAGYFGGVFRGVRGARERGGGLGGGEGGGAENFKRHLGPKPGKLIGKKLCRMNTRREITRTYKLIVQRE